MGRINKDLANLYGGSHPALQRRDAAHAAVGKRLNRNGNVAGTEADHWPASRKRRHNDFAGLSLGNRNSCLGIANLDVAISMNAIAGHPATLKPDEAEIRGAVTGPGTHSLSLLQVSALGGPVAELTADEGVTQLPVIRQGMAHRFQSLDHGHEKRRAADIGGNTELEHDLGLQFARAGSAGNDGCPDGARTAVEQQARRHQVIGPGVQHDIAGPDSRSSEHQVHAVARYIRHQRWLEDRTRRHVNVPYLLGPAGKISGKWRLELLQFHPPLC